MFAQGLKENQTLVTIELQKCHLLDDQGAYLVSALRHHSTLRILRLEGNHLGTETLSVLGTWVASKDGSKLEILDVGYQNVQLHRGISPLVQGLATNTSLKCLALPGNCLRSDDAVAGPIPHWRACICNITFCPTKQLPDLQIPSATVVEICQIVWTSLQSSNFIVHLAGPRI